MNLIIVPPKITRLPQIKGLSDKKFFIVDSFKQKELFKDSPFLENNSFGLNDILDKLKLDDINDTAKYFARNWFRQDKPADLFLFQEINLGGQLISELSLYFIKLLKAISISDAIFSMYKQINFFMIDDCSLWSKACKYIAKERHISLKIIKIKKEKIEFKDKTLNYIRSLTKRLLVENYKYFLPKIPSGGILFSCAPKYYETMADVLMINTPAYYLRPDFSFNSFLKNKHIQNQSIHLVPEYFMKSSNSNNYKEWLKKGDTYNSLDNYFLNYNFFNFRSYNIWQLIREDFYKILDRIIPTTMNWLANFDKMFSEIKPFLVIVEEEICPFNRALIEYSNKKGVPSIHFLHGLLTFDLFASIINSTRFIVPGAHSRQFLTKHGVNEEVIAEIGLPFYEKKLNSIDTTKIKQDFYSKFDLKQDLKLLFLAGQNFFTEEDPYYIGNPLTPENAKAIFKITAEVLKKNKDFKMLIKVYPMGDKLWFIKKSINELEIGDQVLILESADTFELAAISDLVLCGCSTIYLESLLLKIPVLIFDTLKDRFLENLSSDYVYLDNQNEAVNRIHDLINNSDARNKRLEKQEEELSLQFINKNIGSVQKFNELSKELIRRYSNNEKS